MGAPGGSAGKHPGISDAHPTKRPPKLYWNISLFQILLVAGAITALIVSGSYLLPTKRNRYIELCEPNFYSGHIEVAHNLDQVQCVDGRGQPIDLDGNHLTRFVKTK